jgi:hypothetical protein
VPRIGLYAICRFSCSQTIGKLACSLAESAQSEKLFARCPRTPFRGAPPLTATPSTDAPRQVFGSRVFVSGQLSTNESQGTSSDCNSIYVYSPSEVVVLRRQDAEIELDRSRLFNEDASELRGKLRCDLIVPNPAAVVRIVGVSP